MNEAQQVNAVAMAMQGLVEGIDSFVTQLIGTNQHNIVLVVGCCNVSQYGANIERAAGKALLLDLFTRWQLDMPDVKPGEVSPGDTRAFEYLLAQHEEALQADDPTQFDHANRRLELLNYVGRLEALAKRGAAAP